MSLRWFGVWIHKRSGSLLGTCCVWLALCNGFLHNSPPTHHPPPRLARQRFSARRHRPDLWHQSEMNGRTLSSSCWRVLFWSPSALCLFALRGRTLLFLGWTLTQHPHLLSRRKPAHTGLSFILKAASLKLGDWQPGGGFITPATTEMNLVILRRDKNNGSKYSLGG